MPAMDRRGDGSETAGIGSRVTVPAGPIAADWRPDSHRPRGRGASRVTGLFRALRDDIDRGRGFVWAVLAYAAGIWLYFLLPQEPQLPAVMLATAALAALAWLAWRCGRASAVLTVAALISAGVAVAASRTALVAAPVLDRERSVTMSGFVERAEHHSNGLRLVLRVVAMDRLAPLQWPKRVRVTVRSKMTSPVAVGDAVRLDARLVPPPGAIMPGGYDFRFRAFYQGLGATGYAFGPPELVDLGPMPADLAFSAGLSRLRGIIAERILAALGHGDTGALAVALLVGDRTGLSDAAEDALRATGLAHILAISGLHMALFAGSVYAAVRAGLALVPALALRRPIDAWAAVLGLLAATFYLVLSGASVATQRAFVMIALVLVGRIVGRRALTFRGVAVAGAIVLTLSPEALLQPGFQMSFAAVMVLIAAYEEVKERRKTWADARFMRPEGLRRLLGTILRWIAALALTSLVAGLATGLIGAYHFHRVAPLGLGVNILAMPIVSFVVMPSGVIAIALLPLGLESLPLAVMGVGLDAVLAIARSAADLTPGGGAIGMQSSAMVLLAIGGGLALCLFPRGYRLLFCLPFFLLAAAAWAQFRPPDVHIGADGRDLAVRDSDGRLRVLAGRVDFGAETWLRADGVAPDAMKDHLLSKRDLACDPDGCTAAAFPPALIDAAAEPLRIALTARPAALADDCRLADVVVTPLLAPTDCAAGLVADRRLLGETGAISIALALQDGRTVVRRLEFARRAVRPWNSPQRR